MSDTKEKAIDKMKRRAMEWHLKTGGKMRQKVNAAEAESTSQELTMIRELKRLVAESSIERRSVVLSSLCSFERQLAKGESPENLPIFIKNLSKKDGVKKGVAAVTQKYGISGASYYSLWGLNEP